MYLDFINNVHDLYSQRTYIATGLKMRIIPLDTEKIQENWKMVLVVLLLFVFMGFIYMRIIKHNEIFEHLGGCIVARDEKSEWTDSVEEKPCNRSDEIKALRKKRQFVPPM